MNFLNQIINKKSLFDIRFWLFVFFIVRLFHITNPPLEVSHNWRQTTVAMVARNFYEDNSNILYPRLDIGGDKTGITGMEFPILNYLIYLVSLLFGFEDWYGRLINLLVSSFGIYFFYKLIKKYFDEELAFFSSVILLFSIWFVFSRKIMPDTFSVSLVIMSIYYGSNYFEKKRLSDLILYSIFCLLGVLAKLPAGYLLVVFSLFLFNSNYKLSQKIIFSITSMILLIPVSFWYFYWVPYLNTAFDFTHFYMGTNLLNGYQELKNHLFLTLYRFFDNSIKYIGFLFFLIGLFLVFKNVSKKMKFIFITLSISFFVIMLKAGFAFHHHNYYIIPFVPVMALISAYGITQFKLKQFKYFILIAISVEGFLNYQDDFFIKKKDGMIFNLEKQLDVFSTKTDYILINSGDQPTPMYFAHRKGWVTFNDSIKNESYLLKLKQKNLKYIVILKQSFGTDIELQLPICITNEYYTIYKII
jgi:4-amino-4-deoxy-L-arabinose transferase-like glycosyltransferase